MSSFTRPLTISVCVCGLFVLVGCRAVSENQLTGPATFEQPANPANFVKPASFTEPASAMDVLPKQMPRELFKAALPAYVIEPPDILELNAIRIVLKPNYALRPADILLLNVLGTLPDAPISGPYKIDSSGIIDLGEFYGSIEIAGATVRQAKKILTDFLLVRLKEPLVSLSLMEDPVYQQIAGQHLVGPDGTVTLGVYGPVSVLGKTIPEAKIAIEERLSEYFEKPEVSVNVFAYNSKVYYIITEGAGLGDGVFRFPITGNETVLDAISNINGLEQISSKRIWIARPTPNSSQVQILPVDWKGVTAQAATGTNYQLFPGDRVFVAEDKLIAFDSSLGKRLAPFERIFGFALLGTGAVTRFSGNVLRGGGNARQFGGGGF